MVFVVDRSGSIGSDNYELMKDFIESIVSNFIVGPDGVHVGLISFNDDPLVEFGLLDHLSNAEVLAAVEAIVFTGGGNNFHNALQLTLNGINWTRLSADVAGVVVFLTDGQDWSPGAPEDSDAIRAAGIKLLTVGIGYNVDEIALVRLGGAQENFFHSTDFSQLGSSLADSISSASC
jgi:Mg-chelatase subunit ChlD